MQNSINILKQTVTGLEVYTNPFTTTDSRVGMFIKNDTDISLNFTLYAAIEDADKDGAYEWAEVLDPSTETQITYTVASGDYGYRLFSGSPTGVKYRLYCDAQLATGSVSVISVK